MKKLPDRFRKYVDVLLESIWVLTALSAVAYSIYSKFVTEEDTPAYVTLALLGLMATGLWKAHRNLDKKLEEQSSAFQAKLEDIIRNLPAINDLLSLPPESTISVVQVVRQTAALSNIMAMSDEPVRKILDNGVNEITTRHSGYSMGRINVPILESPSVNYEIMEGFGDRMDAVSRMDTDFWLSPLGQEYLDKSKSPRTRMGRSKLTRIFIYTSEHIQTRSNDIIKILNIHHQAKIGFAIVMDTTLGRVIN